MMVLLNATLLFPAEVHDVPLTSKVDVKMLNTDSRNTNAVLPSPVVFLSQNNRSVIFD